MAFANKRKKSSTTELPASLREELGLGNGNQAALVGREGRQVNTLRRGGRRGGVIGRKDARKAERMDKKVIKRGKVQQPQTYKVAQRYTPRVMPRQLPDLPSRREKIPDARDKGKSKETNQGRRIPKERITMEQGQRKHVGQGEATPLQRLMNRNASSSRTDSEPFLKKPKMVPLSIVEQQEEDEIAWLEAHLGNKKAKGSTDSTKAKKRQEEEKRNEGTDGGEDGLDDLLEDLDRFYPGMYDGAGDTEEEDGESSSSEESSEDLSRDRSETETRSSDEDASMSDEKNSIISDSEEIIDSLDEEGDSPAQSQELPIVESPNSTGRYLPPALRQKTVASSDTADMLKLRRQAQGLLNRLGEGNIESIVMEMMESLYRQYSRANVTEVLTTLVIHTVTSSSNLVDTFVILYAALVASLHRLVGLEFGAHFLQTIVEIWRKLYREAREKQMGDSENVEDVGKEAKNLLLLLANMYNLGVVACPLIFDIIKVILGVEQGKATRPMTEIDVELLLRIVKTSGSQLRHDDSTSLKTIVQLAQQSTELVAAQSLSSRSKFMLEALEDVKNSRTKAGANQGLEQQSIARMKKYLAGLSKRRTIRTQESLRVGLQDLLDVDKRGKWWLIGAAWAGYELNQKDESQSTPPSNEAARRDVVGADEDGKRLALVQIARQHGMNTAIRQDIFIILMSSQDYLDALEKLQSLKFKKESQRREVIRVILHCIGSEINFNPYYVILASRLAVDDIGTKYTLQYCLWDFLRELGEKGVGGRSIVEREEELSDDEDSLSSSGSVTQERMTNIARSYGWWIAKGALSLSAMRVIDFTTLKSKAIHFLQELLVQILLSAQTSSPTLTLRLAPSKKSLHPLHQKEINFIDQSAKETVEGIFVKGTLANVALCQGLLFFFERNLKPKDCQQIANSLGAISYTTNQLLWARSIAKQIVKIGAHSSGNADEL